MAKKLIADAIAEMIAKGAFRVESKKFTAADGTPLRVRSMDSDYDPLEVGDVLHIPQDFDVLEMKFNQDDPDEKPHQFVVVEVTQQDGNTRHWRFFPNSLMKARRPFVDGHYQKKVKSTGTAVDLALTVDTVNELMDLLRGKNILVADATLVTEKNYRTGEIRDTHIYKYDLK